MENEKNNLEATIISMVTHLVENCPTRLLRLQFVHAFVDIEECEFSHIGWKMENFP